MTTCKELLNEFIASTNNKFAIKTSSNYFSKVYKCEYSGVEIKSNKAEVFEMKESMRYIPGTLVERTTNTLNFNLQYTKSKLFELSK